MGDIYMDYAAATPLDERVMKAMLPYFTEHFYNPSAMYKSAIAIRRDIESARGNVAQALGVRPAEIIFTAGGTESNNLAIHGVMRQYPDAHIVVSSIEHDSVLIPARMYDCIEAPVKHDGIIDLEALKTTITDRTVLISIMLANNEIGTIQPLVAIAKLIKEIRRERVKAHNLLPIYFHTDACQAVNYLHTYANTLGVDMMTINSGKIYGPKQCGALFIKSSLKIQPIVQGGGQEQGIRSGTENVAGIIGFATAMQLTQAFRETETQRLIKLQQLFIDELEKKVPQAVLNGSRNRIANNIHITIPKTDNERMIFALDEQGIHCAAGSACSASKTEPSHTLKAIGLSDKDAQSSLRFTMGRGTYAREILHTVNVVAKLVA